MKRRYLKDLTIGYIKIGSEVVKTIEPPRYKGNGEYICVAEDIYKISIEKRNIKSELQGRDVYELFLRDYMSGSNQIIKYDQIPISKTGGVYMHKGSFVRNTYGCIIVGDDLNSGQEISMQSTQNGLNKMLKFYNINREFDLLNKREDNIGELVIKEATEKEAEKWLNY